MRDCVSSSFMPISYSSFFHCGSAGATDYQLKFSSTSGLREHGFNVTQSWPGILKFSLKVKVNLVPRVLRLFGQRVSARRDSGIMVSLGALPLCRTIWSETSETNQEKNGTTIFNKSQFPTGPKRSIYVSTEISVSSQ